MSIAIRAYRRLWLPGAMASVLRQTWHDLELVIYDDAGDLEDVAAGFDDGRVRYVRAERKLEASGRFAAAIALCRGMYIGVLDDDDRYEPQFIERLVTALEADPGAGAAFCREINDAGGVRFEARRPGRPGRQPDLLRRILAERWVVPASAMLMRRVALDAAETLQPMPDGVAPDVFVGFRLVQAGWEVVFVDEILAVRGCHEQRISKSMTGADYAVTTFERLQIGDRELDRLRRRELARRLIVRAGHRLVAGRRSEALEDVSAATESDASAHRWLRRLVGFAALTPLLGTTAARLARAVHHRFSLSP